MLTYVNANRIIASKPKALLALLLLVPAPSIGVLFAMVLPATAGTPLGQSIFAASKLWVLILPLIWLLTGRTQGAGLRPSSRGLAMGVALGLVISAAIGAAFFLFARVWIDVEHMRESALRIGLGQPAIYIAFAIYTIVINAWLEEFVWRWFVFRQCETLMPAAVAIIASSLMFTAHHVLALKVQSGWNVTLLASLGVFMGGCIWSWLYLRYRSIWPGYASHIIVDIAVFAIGWKVIFG